MLVDIEWRAGRPLWLRSRHSTLEQATGGFRPEAEIEKPHHKGGALPG